MLRPVARFCLRRSLSVQDFTEIAKAAFVEVAAEELRERSEKATTSRISVMTGLRRREVDRLFTGGETKVQLTSGIATRVIGHWQADPQFTTQACKPRTLTCKSEESEFYDLVRKVSTDVKPGTVMAELVRIGAIEHTPRGLRLVVGGYVPKSDPEEGFRYLAVDSEDLMLAVEENIFEERETLNLHATTEYDNISARHSDLLRKWLLDEGLKFHKRVRDFLAQFDHDIHPELNENGEKCRVMLGSFSRVAEAHSREKEGDAE